MAYHLKVDTKVDALIVGNHSLEILNSTHRDGEGIVPLSEYRDSDFEQERRHYENSVGPIDTLRKSEVEELIIGAVRFTKWLRFYDAYIGTGNNTSNFRRGIEYILSLWEEHGYFASQQGIGGVKIYTRRAEHIPEDSIDYVNRKINREFMERLKKTIPSLVADRVICKGRSQSHLSCKIFRNSTCYYPSRLWL